MHNKRGQSVLQVARSKSYGQSQPVVLQKMRFYKKNRCNYLFWVYSRPPISSKILADDWYNCIDIKSDSMWGRVPGHIIR